MHMEADELYTFVCWGQVQQPLRNNVGTWVRFANTLIKGLVLCRESGERNFNTVRASAKRLGVLTMESTRPVLTPGLWNNIRVRSVHQPDDHLRRSHHQPCSSSSLSILYPRVFKL
ncbi:uncharacterized protein LOC105737321 [Apis florea]|uniref:uncharacterized protein LOC105737321 n=1 Tax=Apis florea TaxID=7463 RepID=UPI0006293194|nr:uncharacterized protein LOC105737321 [Apis florea]